VICPLETGRVRIWKVGGKFSRPLKNRSSDRFYFEIALLGYSAAQIGVFGVSASSFPRPDVVIPAQAGIQGLPENRTA